MYDLLVMAFDSADAAARARAAVRRLQEQGAVSLIDAAVLTSDATGKVEVDNELSRDVKIGAGIGALLGALFMFFFPFVGIAIGAAGGALVGASLDRGVDQKFVDDVKDSLKPNSSALFLVVGNRDLNALRAALDSQDGRIIHTTLDEGLADQLRRSNQI